MFPEHWNLPHDPSHEQIVSASRKHPAELRLLAVPARNAIIRAEWVTQYRLETGDLFEARAIDKCGDYRCAPGTPCGCRAWADDRRTQ